MPLDYWSRALPGLSEQDPVLKALIRTNRNKKLQARRDPFVTLARAIVSQQISVKAAATVWQRLVDATASVEPASIESVSNDSVTIEPVAGDFASVRPDAIAQLSMEQLRECGLSGRKSTYVVELANHFLDGSLDVRTWRRLDDEQVISELIRIKGIGRWTAEMFLMFFMLRPNVLPVDDIGLQRAMRLHYNDGEPLSKPEMREIAENWQPWCTVATWFMWRSIDPKP
jgi:DNA-3-methyladenine glycosylase II